MSINKVFLLGNLGIDPSLKELSPETKVANFTIATSETYTDKAGIKITKTEWHNIVCWNNTAVIAQKFLKKGNQVFIEGQIKTRSYKDSNEVSHSITEVFCEKIQLIGSRKNEE